MSEIKYIRLALTEEQIAKLQDMKSTIDAMFRADRPGLLFAKVDVHDEEILAIFWPHEPAGELIHHMDLLMKFYDIHPEYFESKERP
jgi:hypothetical protein